MEQQPTAASPQSASGFNPNDIYPDMSKLPPPPQVEKPKTSKLLPNIKILAAGLLLVLVIAGFYYYKSTNSLTTVDYNNNEGAQFQLKFYPNYSVKSPAGVTSNVQELAATNYKHGKYPLTFFISTTSLSDASTAAAFDHNKSCGSGFPLAFSVQNSQVGPINVCAVDQPNTSINTIDIASFKDSKNYCVLTISQDVNWQQIFSSKSAAQAGISKIGLDSYSSDINAIVASIKPL